MKRVSLKSLLNEANGYAIPAINAANFEEIDAVLQASYNMEAPIIIQVAKIQIDCLNISIQSYINMVAAIALNYNKGRYAIHLDHCDDLNYLQAAYEAGLDSMMFDGSALAFNENMALTKQARLISPNMTLEAELGSFGEEGASNLNLQQHFTPKEEIALFIKETKVDMIAIPFGNAHGFYKGKPQLDFNYLKEVAYLIDIPIVLHGATGIAPEDLEKAIKLGIKKVNFFTTINHQYQEYIANNIKDAGMMVKLMQGAKQAMVIEIEKCIEYTKARKRL
ncbi:MAG: class II fructose-bisphosphate aldolase [Bacilli bacterium]